MLNYEIYICIIMHWHFLYAQTLRQDVKCQDQQQQQQEQQLQ